MAIVAIPMFDTAEQIENQLIAGEDSQTEFKELRLSGRGVQAPNAESVAGEMVAFANADGGTFFLGVNDAGAPLGIPQEHLDAAERWFLNIATENCDPPIRPIVRKHVVQVKGECKRLILAEIPRGLYVHRTTGGRYYQRIGSTKRDLTPSELAHLFQQRGREYVFDERAVHAASVSDLNQHRLEAFFGRSQTIPWLDLLRNTRVITPDEQGADRPTVAGLLAFATEPADFLPSCSIEAACYAGAELSSDHLRRVERLAGTAPDQIDAATAFVAQFMQEGRAGDGAPAYDVDVVDEAIVAARGPRTRHAPNRRSEPTRRGTDGGPASPGAARPAAGHPQPSTCAAFPPTGKSREPPPASPERTSGRSPHGAREPSP